MELKLSFAFGELAKFHTIEFVIFAQFQRLFFVTFFYG